MISDDPLPTGDGRERYVESDLRRDTQGRGRPNTAIHRSLDGFALEARTPVEMFGL